MVRCSKERDKRDSSAEEYTRLPASRVGAWHKEELHLYFVYSRVLRADITLQ